MFKKKYKAAATIMMVSLLGTSPAFAGIACAEDEVSNSTAISTASTEVTAGPISIGSLGRVTFTDRTVENPTTNVTLTGEIQTLTSDAIDGITLVDATGSGSGWHVNLRAEEFQDANTDPNNIRTLPGDSLKLGNVTITAQNGSTPVDELTTKTGTIDSSEGINIVSAAAGGGMGTYSISMEPMTLTLNPKDAYAGTYTSTITITLLQGPAE